jgi:hypothetical protein
VTAANKVYDATTAATITGRTLSGVIAGDSVTYSGGSATFADKNVGTGKTVTTTGLGLAGTDAGNYTVNAIAITTADITALALTGAVTAANKIYDGTPGAMLASRTLAGVIAGDSVAYSGGIATFSDRNVGTAKTVTATGLGLTGTDSGNYTVNATAATTADISVRPITVTASPDSRTYDGTTNSTAMPAISGGLGAGDTAAFTQTFDTRNVGTARTLTPAGAVADGNGGNNYAISFVTNAVGMIGAAPLRVTADDKSRPVAAPNPPFTATYAGFVPGDSMIDLTGVLSFTTAATLASPPGPYAITPFGQSAANYTITYVNGTLTIAGTADTPPPSPVTPPPTPAASPASTVEAYQEALASTRSRAGEREPVKPGFGGRVFEVEGAGIRLPPGFPQ